MNCGCYQPGMVGMMPTFRSTNGTNNARRHAEQILQCLELHHYQLKQQLYDQMNHRLTRLEQQVKTGS